MKIQSELFLLFLIIQKKKLHLVITDIYPYHYRVSELDEVVKQGIFKILSDYLGPELCDNINEYHFDEMNLL